jgi:hypothetical protein
MEKADGELIHLRGELLICQDLLTKKEKEVTRLIQEAQVLELAAVAEIAERVREKSKFAMTDSPQNRINSELSCAHLSATEEMEQMKDQLQNALNSTQQQIIHLERQILEKSLVQEESERR